ncbi:MAG: efflux RND transporter periplasmic adaptor subunit [Proteobacteria bacterium]|nr:efflux RND transporter periplasmic adaptor subunit [Pseudomonadota bacterium]
MSFDWNRLKWPLLALAVVIVAVLALRPGAKPAAQGPAPEPVQAVVVGGAGAGAETGERYAATIHRDREANLSFRVAGTLRAVPVRPGQTLGAGALIAALDATPYAAGAARAEAEADRASRAADRYAALAPAGAVGEAQARDAGAARKAAEAQLSAARFDLAATRLVMPFAGVVISRRAEVGESVGAGQVVAQVADLGSPLIATAQVPAELAARLHPGMTAKVDVAGHAQPLAARVLRISGGADPRSGLVAVDLALAGAGALPSGTAAGVRFDLPVPAETSAAAILIPAEALLEAEGDAAHVYVIDAQGKARRRAVRFLGFADQAARVTGLHPGEKVVTLGAGFVAEGQAVTVVAP